MGKRVELPLAEPLYSTYHCQGAGTAVLLKNPTVRNWYLNEVMNLTCNRKFLSGYTTPRVDIRDSGVNENPYLDRKRYSSEFTKGYINVIIRELLDKGFYVVFNGVDDYYLEGKTWYRQRHFKHDGMICGYDQNDKTFCIYAYDSNWIYRKFWVSQRSFNKGRIAMLKQGIVTHICGIKVKRKYQIEISPRTILDKLKEYLDSDIEKYPFSAGDEGDVYGIVVHEYVAEYVKMLFDGSIPYERMDRRVFRVIWEHKKAMLERIHALEEVINLDKRYANEYEAVVTQADKLRMLYASHHMRRRDSVLPTLREKLLLLSKEERRILTCLIETIEKELNEDALDTSEK